jgi:hypothetical protein
MPPANLPLTRRSFIQAATAATAGVASFAALKDVSAGQAAAAPTPGGGGTHAARSNRQLFIDEQFIEKREGAQLTVNPPQRKELVLFAEHEWESGGITSYCNVLWDEQHKEYRLYYVPVVPNEPGTLKSGLRFHLALATSKDGIHWEKPERGVVDFRGSKKNNIVIDNEREGTVIIDPNAPPERRYGYLSGVNTGIYYYSSADGVTFNKSKDPVSPHHSDSQISTFWDDQRKKYVHHFKAYNGKTDEWYQSPQIEINPKIPFPQKEPLQRTVARIETENLGDTWKGPFRVVMAKDPNDPPGMDLYTNAAEKYALTPDVYVAFPTPYYHYNEPYRKYLNEPTLAIGGKTNDGSLETQLAVSRDGITWTRHRTSYVPMFRHDGLDLKVVMGFPGIIYHPDRIDQYVAGYAFTHGDTQARVRLKGRELGGVYRLCQRIDGFMSADFAYGGGSLVTRPLTFEGKHLLLNVNTSASGEGRVAILDESSKEIPGFGIADSRIVNGDYLYKKVEWNGGDDVSKLAGKPVRLRFEMRGTKLYSFRFADA